jgi:hypothetical protein
VTTLATQLTAMLDLDALLDDWAIPNPEETKVTPDPYAGLEAALVPLRTAHPGITNHEAAPLLPEPLRRLLWERAVDRYLGEELAEMGARPQRPTVVTTVTTVLDARPCCDSHNRHCEPPGDLCCARCTEAAHDTFPIRHADRSVCVMTTPTEPAKEPDESVEVVE